MFEFAPAPASLPPGRRIYAVGDVHGCAEKLTALHQAILADLRDRPIEAPLLVHLGDYIDRGPDSAEVVARLSGPPLPGLPAVNLMGNHEHMMLSALVGDDRDAPGLWLENGGADALHSWGVPQQAAPRDWARRLPPAHLIFLRDLALSHCEGGYLFVHAGIRPGVPLERQTRHDLLWMREPFLSCADDLGVVVVHGHTPKPEPVVRPNRIGIDTGAVLGGPLTCAVLEAYQLGFITT